MKSIFEWMMHEKLDEFEYEIDQDWIEAFCKLASDSSNEMLHGGVDTPVDYMKTVPAKVKKAIQNWNDALETVAKNKSLNLRDLKTATLGVLSTAWFVLFESYRAWGAEYAAKKGRAFTSELNKEIAVLSDAWVKVKAGKPV